MDSSNYRDLILIENQVSQGQNEYGTEITSWVVTAKRFAEAVPLKGDQLLMAGQIQNGIPYEFKLYYEKDLLLTTDSRIIFRNLEFVLHTVYDLQSDFTEYYALGFGKRRTAPVVMPNNKLWANSQVWNNNELYHI